MKKFRLLIIILFSFLNFNWAQTNPAAQPLPYSQDFNSLAHTSTTYPAGWQGWTIFTNLGSSFNTAGPTADRTLTASSTAVTTSGNVHNYNGKIGYLNSSSLDLTIVLSLNTTGKENVQASYNIMTIRNPYDGSSNTRINEVTLQYRIGTTGAFTTLTGVEYQNNTTLQTGSVTTPQKLETKNITLPSSCDDQSVVQIRWVSLQISGTGSRPSFAFDNISITGDDINPITSVQFATASTTVNEGVGTYNLDVTISNEDATNPTTADVVLISGDAADLNNYTTQQVTFPAGSSTNQTVVINVTDDAVVEGSEDFIFELQNISGGNSAVVGTPSQFTLTVTDNDYPNIVINEVDADQVNTDTNEFIELVADVSTSLTDILVVLHNGSGGFTIGGYSTYNLDGQSFPSTQIGSTGKSFFVLGPPTLAGFTSQAFNLLYSTGWPASDAIQNGGSNEADGLMVVFDKNNDGNYNDGIDVIIDKLAYVGSVSGVDGGSATFTGFKNIYGSTGSIYILKDGGSTTEAMGRGSDDLTSASGLTFNYTSIYQSALSPTP